MNKIALIGAGSVIFAKNLIADILQYPALAESTICLMDIDPRRLSTIDQLARQMVAQLGVKARIESTLDLRTACTGAKYVITTFQVGGYMPSTLVDFEIPARYGIRQTIGDTLGVGGVFRALRSIPELVRVGRMLEEYGAASPLLLNYSNPMAMNMWATRRLCGVPAVGLCHSVQQTSRQLASYCRVDYKDVSYLVAGVNHMAFFLKFDYQGKDAYPMLFRALRDPNLVSCDRVRFEMMRRLGYFVTESSEHQSEYVPYFIHHGAKVIEDFGIPINEYIRRCEVQIDSWGKIESVLLDESRPVEISRSVEYGSTIINSMVTGTPSVIYGNVPNTGLITNLPQGCCVEVPCLVDAQGIAPTHIGDLPPQLAAIIRTNVNVQELAVEAAVTGRRDYIYQAVMADPHTASALTLDKIWAMCDEMIEAHQRDGFLGEFKPVVRNTGKPLQAVARVFLSIQPDNLQPASDYRDETFKLVAENEMPEPFEGDVEIQVDCASILPNPVFHLDLSPFETVKIPFALASAQPLKEAVEIRILSNSPKTIERVYRFAKRFQINIPSAPLGDRREPFTIEWNGEKVAQGAIGLSPEELFIEGSVNDASIRVDEKIYWDGSAVEIGLKSAVFPNSPLSILAILPFTQEPQLLLEGKPFHGGSVTVTHHKSGYHFQARVSLKKTGLSATEPFLFNLVCYVNELGLHGKTRVPWQPSENLRVDQSRFAVAVPQIHDQAKTGVVVPFTHRKRAAKKAERRLVS